MQPNKITEAEWSVMETLWNADSALSSASIVEALKKQTSWAPNTIRTLLNRLVEKGFVAVSKPNNKFLYSPVISRSDSIEREGRSFLERIFGGKTAPLLLHFAGKANLTEEELNSLQAILNKKENNK